MELHSIRRKWVESAVGRGILKVRLKIALAKVHLLDQVQLLLAV